MVPRKKETETKIHLDFVKQTVVMGSVVTT